MWNYILTFLFGGTVMSGVQYLANNLQNTALAAILALTPLGFLCGYLIHSRILLQKYVMNLAFVMAITVVVAIIIYYLLLKFKNLSSYIILTAGIIVWGVFQYIKYNSF